MTPLVHQSRPMAIRIAGCAFAIVVSAAPQAAVAQGAADAYPNKLIRVIVPVAPGGASDLLARLIGAQLTAAWGQQVIVDSRPGAGGQIGSEAVARAPKDGYTLLFWDFGSLTISAALRPTFTIDPARDFMPVTVVSYSPHLLVVHPSVPASNMKQLIALAKAHPGKLNYAATGIGSAPHLAGILFEMQTGINWEYIPAKGGAQAMLDVMTGQSDVLFNSMFATLAHVNSKRLKLLTVSSPRRMVSIPDTPTVIESGLAGFVTGSWQGMLAPAGTPGDVLAKLQKQIAGILAQPDMRQKLAAEGADVVANTPQEAHAFLREQQARWAKLVKQVGIKVE